VKLVWGISGSFCNHAAVIKQINDFILKGYEIYPILSQNSASLNTRFGTAKNLYDQLLKNTGNEPKCSLEEVELIGPHCPYDAMIIAPCTSTTLSKLSNGDYDHNCTLAAKAMLRNGKPVILAIASNDILGNTAQALFHLKNSKNIYVVPFGQDDPISKPNSCISRWNLIEKTVISAVYDKIQLQPILYTKEEDYE